MQGTGSFAASLWRRATSPLYRRLPLLLVLVAVTCTAPLRAQQGDSQPTYTLHLYTNLMEIAALVLDSNGRPPKHVDTSRFELRLDDAAQFRPSYVRLQGEDPISLTILLDLSGDVARYLPALRKTIPALAPDVLRPQDLVSLYALDCKLVRSADDLPASRTMLLNAIDAAAAYPGLHGAKQRPKACGESVHLLDSIAVASDKLARLPGRRMLLLVSDGYEGPNHLHWQDLQRFAASQSIAVFAMTSYASITGTENITSTADSDFAGAESPLASGSYNLRHLCEMTGGLSLHVDSDRDVSQAIPHFFELVRGRYILEFHRPRYAHAGLHRVRVTLDKSSAHIYVGGATVASATKEELADPELLRAPTAPVPAAAPQ